MRIIWLTAGFVSLIIGIIGIFLPLLPTTPLLLLSAFCFARSSDHLHDWLVGHPRLGPPIRDWQDSGSISRPAKILAMISIGLAFAGSAVFGAPPQILALQAVILCAVSVFILSRPEPE